MMINTHTEFLQVQIDEHGKLVVGWHFASWRRSFVHMYKGNSEQSLRVTVRIFGWEDNYQNNGLDGQYLDIVAEEGAASIEGQSLPDFPEMMVEVGLGSGEEFFPLLQSERARIDGNHRASNLDKAEWTPFHLYDKSWYSQFSTYTYYENAGGK